MRVTCPAPGRASGPPRPPSTFKPAKKAQAKASPLEAILSSRSEKSIEERNFIVRHPWRTRHAWHG